MEQEERLKTELLDLKGRWKCMHFWWHLKAW